MKSILSFWLLALVAVPPAVIQAAEGPAKFEVGAFSFTRPPAWDWVKVTSSMRKAELRVTDEKTKSNAEVVFFAGFGGGVKANVDRWFAQFEEPREKANAKTEEVTVGKRKVTYASASGTYLSGMPGGPRTPMKNYSLLGAIIEDPSGDIFVRMTGPSELVQKASGEFKQMIEGALK